MTWTEQVAVRCGLGFVVVSLAAVDEIHIVVRGGLRMGVVLSVFKRT